MTMFALAFSNRYSHRKGPFAGLRYRPRLEALEDRRVLSEVDIALNPSRMGFPHPLESDQGWGGGSDRWEIVDGRDDYPEWYHGLAFTGGRLNYVEPAGPRQATINFGQDQTFHEAILWHHGLYHIPADTGLQVWDGSQWNDISFTRFVDVGYHSRGAGSTPDYYFFENVTGSKIRYTFDNRLDDYQHDQQIEHGWLYEFEVYSTVDNLGGSPANPAFLHMAVASAEPTGTVGLYALAVEGPITRTEAGRPAVVQDQSGLINRATPASARPDLSQTDQQSVCRRSLEAVDLLFDPGQIICV